MKQYRSLIYRELKLTRKRFILMLILFLLMAILMMIPLFLGGFSELDESPLEIVILFSCAFALIGGLMAGTNNGLQKADINSGWKRYSFVLPATAKQQALSDLMLKLCYIALFGAILVVYTLIYGYSTGCSCVFQGLNFYLGTVAAVMLIDAAYSYIIMFAKTKNELKIIGVIAFIGAGLILKVADLFSMGADFLKGDHAAEQPAEDGALISDAAFNRFVNVLGSGKTMLYILAVLFVICALYFLAMWRSHERREP